MQAAAHATRPKGDQATVASVADLLRSVALRPVVDRRYCLEQIVEAYLRSRRAEDRQGPPGCRASPGRTALMGRAGIEPATLGLLLPKHRSDREDRRIRARLGTNHLQTNPTIRGRIRRHTPTSRTPSACSPGCSTVRATMVRHGSDRTFNPKVAGSIPARPMIGIPLGDPRFRPVRRRRFPLHYSRQARQGPVDQRRPRGDARRRPAGEPRRPLAVPDDAADAACRHAHGRRPARTAEPVAAPSFRRRAPRVPDADQGS